MSNLLLELMVDSRSEESMVEFGKNSQNCATRSFLYSIIELLNLMCLASLGKVATKIFL